MSRREAGVAAAVVLFCVAALRVGLGWEPGRGGERIFESRPLVQRCARDEFGSAVVLEAETRRVLIVEGIEVTSLREHEKPKQPGVVDPYDVVLIELKTQNPWLGMLGANKVLNQRTVVKPGRTPARPHRAAALIHRHAPFAVHPKMERGALPGISQLQAQLGNAGVEWRILVHKRRDREQRLLRKSQRSFVVFKAPVHRRELQSGHDRIRDRGKSHRASEFAAWGQIPDPPRHFAP